MQTGLKSWPGGPSRTPRLLWCPYGRTALLSRGKVVPFHPARGFGREACGARGEEGGACPGSQASESTLVVRGVTDVAAVMPPRPQLPFSASGVLAGRRCYGRARDGGSQGFCALPVLTPMFLPLCTRTLTALYRTPADPGPLPVASPPSAIPLEAGPSTRERAGDVAQSIGKCLSPYH